MTNLKVDFHIHSKYSFDSFLSLNKILKVAKRRGLSGVAITDHDTIKGGVEASKLNKFDEEFRVIIGAEIRTNLGDLIGIFLNEEIKSKDFYGVVDEIKVQGGIVILPHPYRTFIAIDERILDSIDILEGFNARMRNNILNQKAQGLARKYKIPVSAGSDAHYAHEIGNGRTVFPGELLETEEIRKLLLNGKVTIEGTVIPFPLYVSYEFVMGRIIKAVKPVGGNQR